MQQNLEILQELREVSPELAKQEKVAVFSVPSNYFETLAEEILGKIRSGEEGRYYFGDANPYVAPIGYLERLTGQIMSKVNSNDVNKELENVAPILNTISKGDVYSVPEGYFSSISPGTGRPAAKPAKIVRFNRSLKYVAAAVIIALLVVAGFLINNSKPTEMQAAKKVESVEVKKLSEAEIVEYLNPGVRQENVSGTDAETGIQTSVKQLADDEIKQYLIETGDHEEI